jgi:glycerol uptake facilitator-like aquaporin
MKFNLRASLTAEFLGSALLVAAVIGSGIMGERLAGGTSPLLCLRTRLRLALHWLLSF